MSRGDLVPQRRWRLAPILVVALMALAGCGSNSSSSSSGGGGATTAASSSRRGDEGRRRRHERQGTARAPVRAASTPRRAVPSPALRRRARRSTSARSTPSSRGPTSPTGDRWRGVLQLRQRQRRRQRPPDEVLRADRSDAAGADRRRRNSCSSPITCRASSARRTSSSAPSTTPVGQAGIFELGAGIAPECSSTPNSAPVNMGPRSARTAPRSTSLSLHPNKIAFDQSNVPGTGYIAAGPTAIAAAAHVPIKTETDNVPINDANTVALRLVNDALGHGGAGNQPHRRRGDRGFVSTSTPRRCRSSARRRSRSTTSATRPNSGLTTPSRRRTLPTAGGAEMGIQGDRRQEGS